MLFHLTESIMKNKVLNSTNLTPAEKKWRKFCLFLTSGRQPVSTKSTVLSMFCFAFWCCFAFGGDNKKLEFFQRRMTEWILVFVPEYKNRWIKSEFLPVPLYLQMLDILTLAKNCNGTYDLHRSNSFTLMCCLKRKQKNSCYQNPLIWFFK